MTSKMPCSEDFIVDLYIGGMSSTFLVNRNPAGGMLWNPRAGFVICGWQKGRWRTATAGRPLTDNDIPFKLVSSDDIIFMGTRLVNVGTALDEHRKNHPGAAAEVMYHIVTDDP